VYPVITHFIIPEIYRNVWRISKGSVFGRVFGYL